MDPDSDPVDPDSDPEHWFKFYFESIISVRSTPFMRKGKDPEPDHRTSD